MTATSTSSIVEPDSDCSTICLEHVQVTIAVQITKFNSAGFHTGKSLTAQCKCSRSIVQPNLSRFIGVTNDGI